MGFALLPLSSGRKLWVTLTGFFLCAFLVVHLIGNLQLLKSDQGLSFNIYSAFMTTNYLIKFTSWVLYISILLHAFQGIYITFRNRKARKFSYAKLSNTSSTWYSRYMGILGTIIFIFVVVHMANFWYQYKFGTLPYAQYTENLISGEIEKVPIPAEEKKVINSSLEEFIAGEYRITIVKDLHVVVEKVFQSELWIVVLYTLSMIALGFHMMHGFQSIFQTLGVAHSPLLRVVLFIGMWIFGILIPVGFAMLPLYIFFNQ